MINRLLPILLIVVSVVILAMYVHPTYTGDIATLSAEVTGYDAALESAKRFKEKEAQLSGQRSLIPPDQLTRLEAFLPDSVDNVQLILDLNALAARSNVRLSALTVASAPTVESSSDGMTQLPLEGQKPYEALQVSVTAQGTYGAFRTFLASAENSLRPLDITELNVSEGGVATIPGSHTYAMTFRIYWLR